ncbi:MAG: ACT domain-containing protein [Oscillospiraceae bacterium]|nr:ACT domain-containing protein [Oscillospiraceae bacterium]
MAINQLSVFVENKPGKLLDIVKALSSEQINIRAMSIADTKDFGILRLIVSDTDKAKDVLESDCIVTVTPVIAAEMSDKAGALSSILEDFSYENINIEYMYAFTASTALGAYVVLRVDDNDAAERVLKSKGISVLENMSI